MGKISANELIERFTDEFIAKKIPFVFVALSERKIEGDSAINLDTIRTKKSERKKKYATSALELLKSICDENKFTIYLIPHPLEDDDLTEELISAGDLEKYYEKHGFKKIINDGHGNCEMIRFPK